MASIPTRKMKFTEARPQLSEVLNQVYDREMRVMVTKGNIPVAAIVSIDDLARLNRLDEEREKDMEVFFEVSRSLSAIPEDEFAEEFAKGLAEVRERDFAILDEFGSVFADVSGEEMTYQVDKALTEVRSEREATTPESDHRNVAERVVGDYRVNRDSDKEAPSEPKSGKQTTWDIE